MFKWLKGKVAALSATAMALVSGSALAQESPTGAALVESAVTTLQADALAIAASLLGLGVAVWAGFYIVRFFSRPKV